MHKNTPKINGKLPETQPPTFFMATSLFYHCHHQQPNNQYFIFVISYDRSIMRV